ncbi:copper resistance CopC family protein [Rhodococcus chondri]|uniref:Copper resistance protein CopC n=1 Tax=Rhodococcus chondri TaxID=3065941 RepID=A0ABU7JKZ2_9NOCA|nr:copper resistance CopC family protein [Rhodococcus sp. CC-R104]MEE2030710.1 copper resistance protein CopC [Rhodococcus sp. CC-R104]
MKRLLIVVATLAAALMLASGPAAAHSVVLSSTPEDGEQIARSPERVEVTFNEAMQEQFAALTVVGPDGNLWSKGEPVVDGATVSVEVGDLGPTGDYTIAYRVTSADGHPVSGTRTFTLTQEGSGTPGKAASGNAESSDQAGEDGGSGPAVWWFVAAGVVVVGAGLWFALRKPKA